MLRSSHIALESMKLHLWCPNVFEFKGGIQVYLYDFLSVLETRLVNKYKSSKPLKISVFDKLDRNKPNHQFNSDFFSFHFSGYLPRFLRTIYFSLLLFWRAWHERPSLIICGHINFAPVAILISRLFKIKYWILVYGIDAWDIKREILSESLHQADKIISISRYTRNRLVVEQKISKNKFSLLPVTFDVGRFHIDKRPSYLLKRYGLHAEQPIILTVARLVGKDRFKGYDQILKALPSIRQKVPDVHYVLVGKGCDRPRIEALIQDLNLQDCVTLTGFVPDEELCDHYNLCDVFAMPSKGEGFGIVYLEALACGKPTLGGNQDGAIDALVNGELGVLVNPDNVDEIAQTLTQILQKSYSHPLLYQPITLRQKVIEYFGIERFQSTLTALLETHLVSEPSSSPSISL